MEKLLKILAVILVFALGISMAACDNTKNTQDKVYTVGISQLIQHVALDAATQGFKDALVDKLGDKVVFDFQNAQGDPATCATIANSLVASKVDLIMANATPALQAAATATADIPILGTSITEYGVALGIKNFTGTVGTNVSGTSDLAPLDGQADMIKELFPNAKTIGLLYCSAEANSLYQVTTIQSLLEGMGFGTKMFSFTDSNDLAGVTMAAVSEVDVIYVPTDNTVASNTGIIDNICRPAKMPVVAGEKGIVEGCGTVTLSIDYYDLGYATGLMAHKILTGQSDVSQMPIEYAPVFTKMYNKTICDELGISVPSDYVPVD